MRARASVGEVSDALEEIFGRFAGQTETVKDIYKNTYGAAEEIDNIKVSLSAFINTTSETPVLYMAKLGQDGHDRGAKVIASAFGDFGLDVRVGDLFQTLKRLQIQPLQWAPILLEYPHWQQVTRHYCQN